MPNATHETSKKNQQNNANEERPLRVLERIRNGDATIGNPHGEKSDGAELNVMEVRNPETGGVSEGKIALRIYANDLEQSATIVVEEPDWLDVR